MERDQGCELCPTTLLSLLWNLGLLLVIPLYHPYPIIQTQTQG